MADTQEEIIIIEEGDASGTSVSSTEQSDGETDVESKKSKKKLLLIGGGALLVLSLLGGGGWYFFFHAHGDKEHPAAETNLVPEKPSETVMEPSQLETMIAQANELYANGNSEEALKLFEKIALYSEAISQYNLGVVQLREGDYESALSNFKRSIQNSENRCVSAINAAVCCLHLGREKDFNYYIDLASAYLPQESTSPLYSYYYALVSYYKGHYLEALSALKKPTTEEYQTTQNRMRAKIDALFGSYKDAISALENPLQEEDSFTLGLLYANAGDLNQAQKYLNDAIFQNPKPVQERLALAFVYLKSGSQEEASKLIQANTDAYPNLVYVPYPIKVSLKPSLYNPDELQKYYRQKKHLDKSELYQTLFYYAPFKIFNADQTISLIRKGNANIFIDDVSGAKEYLQNSAVSSNVNFGIAQAIQKALTFKLRDANAQLKELLKTNPQHSILHYNLGLTYAQLGDFPKAYDHFLRSYHLDANNYMAGIFAMMCGELTSKDNPKLSSILKDNLSTEPEKEEFVLYRTLLDMMQNNWPSAGKWLENSYKDRPLYLAMNALIASENGRYDDALGASLKLSKAKKGDILPHLMIIDNQFRNESTKAFASSAMSYLRKQPLNYKDLYFGPQIVRDRMVVMAAMTGQLSYLIERLERELQTTASDTTDILSALAEAYFYSANFEKAYTLYNQLVDVKKIRDEHTLFLAACASIGAEHYENAIALLELSKLKNPDYAETRYALGLLYMQTENNPAASKMFEKMGNKGFISRYFNFEVDTEKLAEEPLKYHPL